MVTGKRFANIDVHQHLWPSELLDELRRRRRPPSLEGWTLRLPGEPDYEVNPADHDPVRRRALAEVDGTDLALISLSSPLGIEQLPAAEAQPLLDAYHAGTALLGAPFGAWAAASLDAPDPEELGRLLAAGFYGLQLPATALVDAAGYQRYAALLDTLVQYDRPLFVHPGPVSQRDLGVQEAPGWWPAVVSYVGQMHASWYAFHAFGRPAHPELRVCFAMLAGLAPLHWERAANRGAGDIGSEPDLAAWLEVSSYGASAIAAIAQTHGTDVLIRGSDRPYAAPPESGLDAAATRRMGADNPARLLNLAQYVKSSKDAVASR
jgi:6-methylsalicylate decarboxylase